MSLKMSKVNNTISLPDFILLSGTDSHSVIQIAASPASIATLLETLDNLDSLYHGKIILDLPTKLDSMNHFRFLLKKPHHTYGCFEIQLSPSGQIWEIKCGLQH